MSEKVDKFAVFGKKFAKLDNEGQDRLIKTAYELLKVHTSTSPLFDKGMKTQVAHGFNTETEKVC
jgi:hypothetical protein